MGLVEQGLEVKKEDSPGFLLECVLCMQLNLKVKQFTDNYFSNISRNACLHVFNFKWYWYSNSPQRLMLTKSSCDLTQCDSTVPHYPLESHLLETIEGTGWEEDLGPWKNVSLTSFF